MTPSGKPPLGWGPAVAAAFVALCGCSAERFQQDFDSSPLGTYTAAALASDWKAPLWSDGVAEGRVSIVDGEQAYSGRSLQVRYPAGSFGTEEGGAEWLVELGGAHTTLTCSYRVRFGEEFDFVLGGKLPGLAGGTANTDGAIPDGTDGFSARLMWREQGRVVSYVYHPDQPDEYGQDFPWDDDFQLYFQPGDWHLVEQRLVLNTPGQHDGVLEGWLDGVQGQHHEGLRFRDTDGLTLDLLYFSTFFGGDDATWAAVADEQITFDDFVITTAER